MLDVIFGRRTWNCQIRKHKHTKCTHTRTHTKKKSRETKKKKSEKKQKKRGGVRKERVRETGDWYIFLGPPERTRAETGGADQWVLKQREC